MRKLLIILLIAMPCYGQSVSDAQIKSCALQAIQATMGQLREGTKNIPAITVKWSKRDSDLEGIEQTKKNIFPQGDKFEMDPMMAILIITNFDTNNIDKEILGRIMGVNTRCGKANGELAFYLAHQASHMLTKDNEEGLTNEEIKKLELRADRNALRLLMKGKFNVLSAGGFMGRMMIIPAMSNPEKPDTFTPERMANLRKVFCEEIPEACSVE